MLVAQFSVGQMGRIRELYGTLWSGYELWQTQAFSTTFSQLSILSLNIL